MNAIYPGSFNPMHEGHLDIIKKASKLFTKIYVVITKNINKNNLSNFDERYEKVKLMTKEINNVEIYINDSDLTVKFAKKK